MSYYALQAMSSCLLPLHIWLFCSLARTYVSTSSTWFRDKSFDSKMCLSGCGLIARSLIHCADACTTNITCKSFFFVKGQLENCRILSTVLTQHSPNIISVREAAYYIMNKSPGMIFRSTVGIGSQFDTAEAWNAAGPGTTTDTSCRNFKLDGCSKHYRHPIIDDWTTLNPQQLRYSIYKTEVEVAWVLFNATGSNKTNWFHQSRVVNSSFTDLTPQAAYNVFELDFRSPYIDRHFYVNEYWGGCLNDNIWFCTFDDGFACPIDNYGSWPYILYSKLGHKANTGNMSNIDFGDCSVVTLIS